MANTALVQTARWPTTISRPTPGDPTRAGAVATTGSVHPALQDLTDRSAFLYVPAQQLINESLAHQVQLRVTSNQALVYAHGAVALWKDDAKTELVLATFATSVTCPIGITVDALYHFYLWWDSGLALEASTTGPAGNEWNYQIGHPTRRYVGSAWTYDSGGGTPLFHGLRQERGHAILDDEIVLVGPTPGTGGWVTADATGLIPDQVRSVDVYGLATTREAGGGAQGPHILQVRRKGAVTPGRQLCSVGRAATGDQQEGSATAPFGLDDSQRLEWQYPAPAVGNTAQAQLSIVGWYL